jgi:PEGA domain
MHRVTFMKMPFRTIQRGINRHLDLFLPLVFIIMIMATFPPVSAANTSDPGTALCTKTDQFGNPVCPAAPPASIDNAYVPEDAGNMAGATGATYSDTIPFLQQQFPVIKEIITSFNVISTQGVRQSINQTMHADDYTYFTPNTAKNKTGSPVEINSTGARALFSSVVSGVKQLQEISTRAAFRSTRTFSTKNITLWTNRSADDLIGSPLPGPVPDENYLSSFDMVPVNPVPVKNTPVIPPRTVPFVSTQPVAQPTIQPEPVPMFNLSVDSYPGNALVVLNGNRTGMTPLIMEGVKKGTYTLNLTRSGYVPYGEVFTLDSDTNISIPLTSEWDVMFPKAGTSTEPNVYGGLYITSFPGNLELTVDGLPVKGGTPFLFYGLPEGYHTISVTKIDKQYGATTFTRQVWVYRDALVKTEINTEATLVQKQVAVNSESYQGAEFTVNGKYPPGRLPATFNIEMPGSFISVRSGDAYISTVVPMQNMDTLDIQVNKPVQPHAPLFIDSLPQGAEIFIDGFRTGHTTPFTFTEVSSGLHRIGVSIPGYYPTENIITVPIQEPDSPAQKVFFLIENYGEGTIIVNSMPPGAGIYFNGWATGEVTPHTFDHLKIGFYEVAVTQGGKPWINQLELTPNEVHKVVANFNIFY